VKKNIFIFTLLVFFIKTFSQPTCSSNPAASDFCSNATPICNLNGYCGNTSSSYSATVTSSNSSSENSTPLHNVFCASIQNNSWLKFIADSNVAVFDVWVSNCSINKGIQMQIYSTTDCYNFTPVSNCWNPQAPTNGQIIATGLNQGQIYYFMIDGTMGDICDYVIAANSGISSSPTVTHDQSICIGSTVTITATNGNSYTWSSNPIDPNLSGQSSNSSINVSPTTTTIYYVTVTKTGDNLFCSNNITILQSKITVNTPPKLDAGSTDEHCSHSDGTMFVNIIDSSGTYNYFWNTTPTQNNQTAQNLTAGNYSVTVKDSNGCSTISSVTVNSNPNLEPNILGPSSICDGTEINIEAVNTFPVSYLWSTGENTQIISVSSGGLYSVTASDCISCSGTSDILIEQLSKPEPQITGLNYVCYGSSISLVVDSSYSSYLWSSASINQAINISYGGIYYVTVTDSNNCSGTANHTVDQKYGPTLLLSSTNEICNKLNGTATVIASGGEGYYSYLWNNGAYTNLITGLSSGLYSVTVTDDYCPTSSSVKVFETPGPTADFYVHPQVKTYLDEPVKFSFNDNSLGSIIKWLWDFGDGSSQEDNKDVIHYYNGVGIYTVMHIVIDTNDCADTATNFVKLKDIFTFYIPSAFSPNGDGINEVFEPKGENVDPDNFNMYIYDRWGKLVYKTSIWNNSSTVGWNGTENNKNGETYKPDIYVYKILLKEIEGPIHEYEGSLLLIK